MTFSIKRLVAIVTLTGALTAACGGDDTSTDQEADVSGSNLDVLRSLPYTSVVTESPENRKRTGVQRHDRSRAWQGVNLYCNHFEKTTGAYLLDMDGSVLHRWTLNDSSEWKLVVADDDGSVVGILRKGLDARLVKLDWDSNLLFSVNGDFHHDLQLLPDGRMVTLSRRIEVIPGEEPRLHFYNDYLVRMSPAGEVLDEVSLYDVVENDDVMVAAIEVARRQTRRGLLDLHTNTVRLLTHRIDGFCEPGDLLLCLRNLDLVMVYDLDARQVRWKHYGRDIWQHPHEPTLVEGGRVLLFDNGYLRGYSRVIEFDPLTMSIEWEYRPTPPETLFTKARGSVQRLPNGNTLITESDNGRVIEVTPSGEVVWEWLNTLFSENGKRATVYRMKRHDRSMVRDGTSD